MLLKAGADLNKASNSGTTPVCIASPKGRVEVIKMLLKAGVDLNKASNSCATPTLYPRKAT